MTFSFFQAVEISDHYPVQVQLSKLFLLLLVDFNSFANKDAGIQSKIIMWILILQQSTEIKKKKQQLFHRVSKYASESFIIHYSNHNHPITTIASVISVSDFP